MTDIYEWPNETQTTGINEIASYVNDVTNGAFFPLILLAIFVIAFVSTMHFGQGRAFVYSSFFCSIIAIFMVIAGVLNTGYMYLLFIMLGIGLMSLRIAKSSKYPQI